MSKKAVWTGAWMLSALLSLFFVAGCGRAEGEGDVGVYYLNKERTKIMAQPYDLKADQNDTEAVIEELLSVLASDTKDVEYVRPIPEQVKVLEHTLEESLLTLYFEESYSSMDRVEEVLVRAAIVRTMTQVEGIECLSFYVGGVPVTDGKGSPIGVMTNDSFIENPGEQINSIQTANLVLYFANNKGNALVQETKEVHYSSNISMEKLIMEYLLEGPRSQGAQSAIPEGTMLMNVSVLEGVCYVSLDEGFLNQNYKIDEAVVIYSIVNSLSEIATINKVQISVNGDTSVRYRDKFALDELYERNLDYVEE